MPLSLSLSLNSASCGPGARKRNSSHNAELATDTLREMVAAQISLLLSLSGLRLDTVQVQHQFLCYKMQINTDPLKNT